MQYTKINITNKGPKFAYFSKFEIPETGDPEELNIMIPLDKFKTAVPEFNMLSDGTVSVYFEEPHNIYQKISVTGVISELTDQEKDTLRSLAKRAIDDQEFDTLIAPPNKDEKIDTLLDEFFTDVEDSELEQKNFIDEFFANIDAQADN